jgi:hypothetical protein
MKDGTSLPCSYLHNHELTYQGEMELEKEGTLNTQEQQADWQNYIKATKPHSKIAFKFSTSLGTVQLHYLRSAIFGLGSVKCWVDDEVEDVTVIKAYWKEIYNIGRYVLLPLLFPPSFLLPFLSSPPACPFAEDDTKADGIGVSISEQISNRGNIPSIVNFWKQLPIRAVGPSSALYPS